MKIHVVLYVIGVLVLLAAWLAQQRYNDQQAKHIEDRVAARVSESTVPVRQVDEIRRELARSGADPAPTVTDKAETGGQDIEDRVRRALQSIPAQRRAEQQRQVDALTAEARAQQFAREIDREFRPRVTNVLQLIDRVISEAAEAGLVVLEGKSEPLALPAQLAYTTFTMRENGIPQEEPGRAMSFRFGGDAVWTLYWKTGMVRSPQELAPGWDAPTEKYYPMLRLKHHRGAKELLLGTVWFHQDLKELRFELNARNELPEQDRMALEKIEQREREADQLSGMLVELLKGLRLNHF